MIHSVIGDDLDVMGAIGLPDKAHAPLVVDADTVLSPAVALKRLELIARRHAQVVEYIRPVELLELAQRGSFDVDPSPNSLALEQRARVLALEASTGHTAILTLRVNIVKHAVHRRSPHDAAGMGAYPTKPIRVDQFIEALGNVTARIER